MNNNTIADYKIRPMQLADNQVVAALVRVNLETHHNLQTAIHIYEKMGYSKIERPKEVAHGTMDHFYYKKLSD